MSDEEENYTNDQLDEWTYDSVIRPLFRAWRRRQSSGPARAQEIFTRAKEDVKRAIREKAWEFYGNGQATGTREQ